MKNAFNTPLILTCILLCATIDAFQSTYATRSLESFNGVSTVDRPRISGHWNPSTSELRNENAFPSTSTSSSLFSIQIRSIFRNEVSETSSISDTADSRQNGPYSTKREYLKAASVQATTTAAKKLKDVSQSLRSLDAVDQVLRFILQYWWSLPAFLALVPLYTCFVLGVGDAAMPHWWSVTRMDHILKSKDASMVLSMFLGSNIAFFLGGGYLLKKFPFVKPDMTSTSIEDGNSMAIFLNSCKKRMQELIIIPTRQTWLGILLLLSGLISTIFHTEQALGSFSIANSLCYLDHAVAGVSTFYFFHTCGRPSKRVWALQIAGLAALSIVPPAPLPGYAWLHSAWHFLAVAAAVLWAHESFDAPSESPLVQSIAPEQE